MSLEAKVGVTARSHKKLQQTRGIYVDACESKHHQVLYRTDAAHLNV